MSRAVINEGLRPPTEIYSDEVVPFTARKPLVALLTKCWDGDSAARPTASEVRAALYELQKKHVKRRQSLILGLPEHLTLHRGGHDCVHETDEDGKPLTSDRNPLKGDITLSLTGEEHATSITSPAVA